MKKCVVFELCNVVLDMDYSHFYQILSEIDFDLVQARQFVENNSKLDQSGIISMKDMLEDDFDPIISDELFKAWSDVPKLNEQMFHFLKEVSLKSNIIFLSSIGQDHLDKVRADYPELMSLASAEHMSCEVGVMKPKKLFYQSFFADHNYDQYYYFDDKQENINVFSSYKKGGYNVMLNLKKLTKEELKYKIGRCKMEMEYYYNS